MSKGLGIEQGTYFGASGRDAADYLGDFLLVPRVAGIDAFWRKAEGEVVAGLHPLLLEHWQQHFFRGAGIGGGFEDHQQAGVGVPGDLLGRGHDVAHVRILGLAQRSGYADVDGVQFRDDGEIRGGAERAGLDEGPQRPGGDVLNIRAAGVQLRDFRALDVDPGDRKSGFSEFHCEGQSDVSESDDPDLGGVRADLVSEDFLFG